MGVIEQSRTVTCHRCGETRQTHTPEGQGSLICATCAVRERESQTPEAREIARKAAVKAIRRDIEEMERLAEIVIARFEAIGYPESARHLSPTLDTQRDGYLDIFERGVPADHPEEG